jgi:hypothetical protein
MMSQLGSHQTTELHCPNADSGASNTSNHVWPRLYIGCEDWIRENYRVLDAHVPTY